jgi:hypothetical protein
MHWSLIVMLVVAFYYFCVFLLSRLIVPHYGWKKSLLPRRISDQLQKEIDAMKKQNPTKDMFLRAAYDTIGARYTPTVTVFFHIPTLFRTNPDWLWNRKGHYISCQQLNFLIRLFCVKSGLFTDNDIDVEFSWTYGIMTHQYLRVYLDDDEQLTIDPWGKQYDLPYGSYGHGFPRFIADAKSNKTHK